MRARCGGGFDQGLARARRGLAWRRGCVWLAAGALALLTGCAGLPPPLPDRAVDGLLDDALFGHPPRPEGADAALAVDEAMRAHLRRLLAAHPADAGRPRLLAAALRGAGALQLDVEDGRTRNAAEAFAARAGNCLSLVLMSAALARELGLTVTFQRARSEPLFSRTGEFVLRIGHVNLVLGPRPAHFDRRVATLETDPERLLVDFLPPEALRGLRTEAIGEATVLAMFANNRAVEALQHGDAALAYAWAREALRHDPGFGAAYNTLGLAYRGAGHAGLAATAFQALLAREPDQVAAMWNLARLLQAQGRTDEAAAWDARRARLEPQAPFAQQAQGEAALARGDAAAARRLFEAEQALTGPSHGLHFLRAQALLRLDEPAQAGQALQQAAQASPDGSLRARYLGKLAALRARGQAPDRAAPR